MYTISLTAHHLERLLESIRIEAYDASQLIDDVCGLISAVHDAGRISDEDASRLKERCDERRSETKGK